MPESGWQICDGLDAKWRAEYIYLSVFARRRRFDVTLGPAAGLRAVGKIMNHEVKVQAIVTRGLLDQQQRCSSNPTDSSRSNEAITVDAIEKKISCHWMDLSVMSGDPIRFIIWA